MLLRGKEGTPHGTILINKDCACPQYTLWYGIGVAHWGDVVVNLC